MVMEVISKYAYRYVNLWYGQRIQKARITLGRLGDIPLEIRHTKA